MCTSTDPSGADAEACPSRPSGRGRRPATPRSSRAAPLGGMPVAAQLGLGRRRDRQLRVARRRRASARSAQRRRAGARVAPSPPPRTSTTATTAAASAAAGRDERAPRGPAASAPRRRRAARVDRAVVVERPAAPAGATATRSRSPSSARPWRAGARPRRGRRVLARPARSATRRSRASSRSSATAAGGRASAALMPVASSSISPRSRSSPRTIRALDRAQRQPGALGDLGLRQLAVEAQLAAARAPRRAAGRAGALIAPAVDAGVLRRVDGALGQVAGVQRLGSPAAQLVDGARAGDREDPRGERAARGVVLARRGARPRSAPAGRRPRRRRGRAACARR